MKVNYWLMKSEPQEFGIHHLKAMPKKTDHWDGIRNFQARNMLRDDLRQGDQVFFYHSNCEEPGIVGIMEVVRPGYPDHTAFDPQAKYYDPKSDPDNPRWYMVDVQYKRHLKRNISLRELRNYGDGELKDLPLLRKGNRLSIMPITPAQWSFILSLEGQGPRHGAR